MLQVFKNAIDVSKYAIVKRYGLKLKYLVVNFHDTNLSNILRFLKYFEENGYEKFVRFSSSVRFELMKDRELEFREHKVPFRIRVVFDG